MLKERFENKNFAFQHNDDGSWQVQGNGVCFSLSHSDVFVAVVVGDETCGVDVEKCQQKILKLKRKFRNECGVCCESVDDLTLAWTKKESLFKLIGFTA